MNVAPSGEWNVNVTSMWISHLFSWTLVLKQLLCWHSFNLKFIRQGAPPLFCPFSLYFFHFRCFNLVPAQNPMFVLGVPIRQKTEVSQQKFVQKHSHQHTFSWFQSVPGKCWHAELVGTDTVVYSVNAYVVPYLLKSRTAASIWMFRSLEDKISCKIVSHKSGLLWNHAVL